MIGELPCRLGPDDRSSRAQLPQSDPGRPWANREAVPIEVDVTDGTVFLDGRILATTPVTTVPLSRRYLLA